jgi:WD40 repeat protein
MVGVWLAETSTLYTTMPVNYPYYIDLSPDGTRLAVFDAEEYSLKLFSLSSYLLERAYSVDGYMNEMRFSPDGTALYAVLSNGQVNRWEVGGSDQPLTRQLPEGYGTRFSLSPGGCLAAWSNWLRVGTYDLCQGSPGFSLDAFTTRGNPVRGWVNGELLFSDSESQPGRVLIRDIFGDVRHGLDISSYNTWMYPVSISPDGTTLVGGVYYQNTYNILLFDLASESLLGMFAVDEYPIDLRFAPDSQSFVYCGSSLTRIYNIHNWWEGPFYSLDGLEYMQVGKYFPAYDLLVLGQFAKVQLVSPASGERFELPVPGGYVTGIALSADGSRVYVASGRSLYVYDRRTGAFVAQAPDSLPAEGYALALNGSETLLAVGDTQGAIHLFDAQNLGWVRTLYRHTYGMADLQFAPDDRALTSTGWDALSVVWAVP